MHYEIVNCTFVQVFEKWKFYGRTASCANYRIYSVSTRIDV